MRLLLMLALMGCKDNGQDSPPTTDDSPSTDSSDVDSAPEDPRPLLQNPAEADDLDPADGVVRVALDAAPQLQQIGEDISLDGYAYNGQTPGPTIRAQVGDELVVEFTNSLDQATTIHWHGLEVPYEMDGVTWTTGGVEPGEGFTYRFTLDRPGTYWYHPHMNTHAQVDRGLYGVLIVEDPAEPRADQELVVVFDDWRPEVPDDSEPPDGHEGTWTLNGLVEPRVQLQGGETVRARLLNASNHGYLDLTLQGLRQIGSDQGLLAGLATPERLLLSPSDRADLELLPGQESVTLVDHAYAHSGGASQGEPQDLLVFEVEPGAAAQGLSWPYPDLQVPTDPGHTDITYVFSGELEGEWLINGERFPDVTVQALPVNEPAIIEVRNLSASEHPFHGHGMHFDLVSLNGVPPEQAVVEDSFNLKVRDAARFRVQPRELGFWMMHCHILEHADGGMMTVLQVQ